jgi:hypothetical protein
VLLNGSVHEKKVRKHRKLAEYLKLRFLSSRKINYDDLDLDTSEKIRALFKPKPGTFFLKGYTDPEVKSS